MTQYEMTEKLSDKLHVTMQEARAALEASGWDMLDAAVLLERAHGAEPGTYSTKEEEAEPIEVEEEKPGRWKTMLKKVAAIFRRLLRFGNRNRFEIRRKDEVVLEMPVTVLVILLLAAFWVCVPLLAVGLFTGFRYAFRGPELGREAVNSAMDQAADAAARMKEEVSGR